jgi:hypothetical protein
MRQGQSSRQLHSLCGGPDRPPCPVVDQGDPPPTGIRSQHSGSRHSRFLLSPVETRPPNVDTGPVTRRAGTRSPASSAAARPASGHTVTAPLKSEMKSRRLIGPPSLKTRHRIGSNWQWESAGCGFRPDSVPCPLWVKSRHVQRKRSRPLYPQKRTFVLASSQFLTPLTYLFIRQRS